MNANPIRTIVDRAGNRSALARLLDVTPQAIRKWERAWDSGNHQAIPAHRAVQIENATGESRCNLRPDLWPKPPHHEAA